MVNKCRILIPYSLLRFKITVAFIFKFFFVHLLVHSFHNNSQALLCGRLVRVRSKTPRMPWGKKAVSSNAFTRITNDPVDSAIHSLCPSFTCQSLAVSTGTGNGDFEKMSAILAAVPQLKYICVDVANGYSEHFVNFVKDVRQKFPSHTIMVRTCWTHFMDKQWMKWFHYFLYIYCFCLRREMWWQERW